jgi:ERCC4-type nuclease
MADLTASIKDGRYKEQKVRMLSFLPAHRITYIIEGGYIIGNSGYGYGLAPPVYTGMYANTMYRDGIHLIYVRNTNETAQWISQVAEKLVAKPDCFDTISTGGEENSGAAAYASVCKAKVKKLDNITPKTCYLLQLAQIPGVSHKIAENIAHVYPTMTQLCQALASSTSRDQSVQLLAKIQLIGKKKAEVLVDYLKPDHNV